MKLHIFRLSGHDFVHYRKIEIGANDRAVYQQSISCFIVYANFDWFLINYQEYIENLSSYIDAYTNRITDIEEKQKAEAEAQKKAEEEAKHKAEEEARKKAEEETAKTHYENEYFSVDVPKEWIGTWSVTEEDNSLGKIHSTIYTFSYDPENDYGGGAMIYVLDMSDTSIPLPTYASMIPSECEEIGVTSFGYYDVFKTEAGAGFFFDGGATITLK